MIFNTQTSAQKIYSVTELNREAKNLLADYFSVIQVEGEISNLSTPSSGHIYFSLKDSSAQIRCAMFKSQLRRLTFKPENGKQVTIFAQVSLYEARGDYQLVVDKIQLAGEGDLQIAFEKLKTKLQKEGLFAQSLKQAIPKLPKRIAIITSPSGAAIHDILSVLKRRFPAIPVIIYPTSVQGETAKYEICDAIKIANRQKKADILLLARGGGAIEDLWAFNEEMVARAIVKSEIPIIAGIGHEIDFTIADFVADLRSPTPSAAAENAVPKQQNYLTIFQSIESQLQKIILQDIARYQQTIHWLNKRLQQQHLSQQLLRYAQAVDNLEIRLKQTMTEKIKYFKTQQHIQANLLQQYNPVKKIIRYTERQQYLSKQLSLAMQHQLETLQRKLFSSVQTLNALSPLATLQRGYAIVSKIESSALIYSSQQLSINELIKTRLAQGYILSQVKKIHD